ncbi:MAG TPA: formyltransferase [Deltaproteobacteria bacterium]|nr:formyltransferase [Deltaproteobacteria bacterium]
MRAVVFAYHEIGYVCLEELISADVEVLSLFTHPDDPGEEIWFRTPRLLAEKYGIPLYEPLSMGDESWVKFLKGLAPDFIFSFYYRNLLPKEVLTTARTEALNLHGSLLPRFRGRCPVNWVLVEGEKVTGVTLHVMEVKPDAGDIVAQKAVAIDFEDTAQSLFLKMVVAARDLMRETLPALKDGTYTRTPQVGPSSYFGGRRPEDGLIDWQQDATRIYNLIRAVTHPYPGAYTSADGKKLYIWRARPVPGSADAAVGTIISRKPLLITTGDGLLRVLTLQLEGEPEQEAEEFFSSHVLKNATFGGTT